MAVRHADEQWLIERARRGDLEAFNALVERYQTAVFNLCLRMLGKRESAEDTTQETFISAFRAISRLQGARIGAWFLRIAANACYDELRRRSRRPAASLDQLLDDPDRSFSVADDDPSPEEESLRSELRHDIQRALGTLPFDQRLAVVLCDVEGFSYDEIAEVMHSSLGTVKSRISRGRTKMRELLREFGEPLPRTGRQET